MISTKKIKKICNLPSEKCNSVHDCTNDDQRVRLITIIDSKYIRIIGNNYSYSVKEEDL